VYSLSGNSGRRAQLVVKTNELAARGARLRIVSQRRHSDEDSFVLHHLTRRQNAGASKLEARRGIAKSRVKRYRARIIAPRLTAKARCRRDMSVKTPV